MHTTPAHRSLAHWPELQPPVPHELSADAYAHRPLLASQVPGDCQVRNEAPTQTAAGGWLQMTPRQGLDLQ